MTVGEFIEAIAREKDVEAIAQLHCLAKNLGRAVGLSCLYAQAGANVEDEVIVAMDKAWVGVMEEAMLLMLDANLRKETP